MGFKVVSFTALLAAIATTAVATVGFNTCPNSFAFGFIPDQPKNKVELCRAGALAISYDVDMIDPAFSAYHITPQNIADNIHGRKGFYLDPDLKALGIKQADPRSDAFNQSWNRGHLCPNRILSYTEVTKKATFTMANVAPQQGYFNQRTWAKLENHVFDWIKAKNTALYIITGVAYIDRSKAHRTFDNIAVPDYYWKVLCDPTNHQSVGVVGGNHADGMPNEVLRPVTEIETIYGGHLFPMECRKGEVTPSHWWNNATKASAPLPKMLRNMHRHRDHLGARQAP